MLDVNFKLFDFNLNVNLFINMGEDFPQKLREDKELAILEKQIKKNGFPNAVDLKSSVCCILDICYALEQNDVKILKEKHLVEDLFSRARRYPNSFETHIVSTVFYEGELYTTETDLEDFFGGFHFWYKYEMPWDNSKVVKQRVNKQSWHHSGIDISGLVAICNEMKLFKSKVRIGDYKDMVAYPFKTNN